LIAIVSMLLLVAIASIVALGDRVGVSIVRSGPSGVARATSWITIQFGEEMRREGVRERLRIEPDIDGELTWSGATAIFKPAQRLSPGQRYTVTLAPGAESASGRQVLREHRFDFSVRGPQLAFLAPLESGVPKNIWLVDPADLSTIAPITDSASGIIDYDVSPDGARIVFSEAGAHPFVSDLKLLDLESGAIQVLVACPDSDCTNPQWSPDGSRIAYERIDYETGVPGVSSTTTRVWLVDMNRTPPTTQALLQGSRLPSFQPLWSPDGKRIVVSQISFIDPNLPSGLIVRHIERGDAFLIDTRNGRARAFSPDGTELIYADFEGERSVLRRIDLDTQQIRDLPEPDDIGEDWLIEWPAARSLTVARLYLDEAHPKGLQLYRRSLDDGSLEPLLIDPDYYVVAFAYDPSGQQLVVLRSSQQTIDPGANPYGPLEIWTYDLESRKLTHIVSDAFRPQWIP
jgi:WD40 repeat protein